MDYFSILEHSAHIFWIDSYLTNLSDGIKKRCFDKSILYIDTRFEKPSKELLQILGSNLQLMELIYGQKFLKSLSVLIIVDEEITRKLKRKSEKYVNYILKDYFPENSVPPKARQILFHFKSMYCFLRYIAR